jgi:hypothetical protein
VTKKVCVVGSTTFPIDAAVGAEIVDLLRDFGEDVVFLTRGSKGFDRFIMQVAPLISAVASRFPVREALIIFCGISNS